MLGVPVNKGEPEFMGVPSNSGEPASMRVSKYRSEPKCEGVPCQRSEPASARVPKCISEPPSESVPKSTGVFNHVSFTGDAMSKKVKIRDKAQEVALQIDRDGSEWEIGDREFETAFLDGVEAAAGPTFRKEVELVYAQFNKTKPKAYEKQPPEEDETEDTPTETDKKWQKKLEKYARRFIRKALYSKKKDRYRPVQFFVDQSGNCLVDVSNKRDVTIQEFLPVLMSELLEDSPNYGIAYYNKEGMLVTTSAPHVCNILTPSECLGRGVSFFLIYPTTS